MKKRLIGLVILLILGYAVIQYKAETDKEKLPEENYQVQDEDVQKDGLPIRITIDQVNKGNLLLINKDHPVPPGAEVSDAVNLSKNSELINGFALLDNSIRLTPFLAQKLSTMIAAAHKDGINQFVLISGYRDEKEQNKLYEEKEPGYALPAGFSEHNLGLALDIGSTQGKMEYAAEGKWLKENAWKYGFILRYPEDKTAITGIPYEPWHFRYIGLPHSAIMYENNFVLEEYLDFLKEQKSIKTTVNHQVYHINYYSVFEDTTIRVPADSRYEISGNNMDGVIVTVYSGQDDEPTSDAPTNNGPTINAPPNDVPNGTPTETVPAVEMPTGAVPADEMLEVEMPAGGIPGADVSFGSWLTTSASGVLSGKPAR